MAQFSKQITLLLRSTFLINLLCISGYTLADPVWGLADEAEYAEILSLIEAPDNTLQLCQFRFLRHTLILTLWIKMSKSKPC